MSVVTEDTGPLSADVQAAFASTLVDEWVRGGVTQAVVCPGSRSTPMAMALVGDSRVTVHIRLDERSAAFVALGIGLASGRPAVLVTTSGTAAAELHPAVVEADLARVPLLVVTADRPPELRDVGAPQTIDQLHLYGRTVRWFADPGVSEEGRRSTWRPLGSRALAEATAGPQGPGPVHLNLPFREPLLGNPAAGRIPPGRPGGQTWHRVGVGSAACPVGTVARIVEAGEAGVPGVIVAGAGCGDPEAVMAVSRALGWPVLADPRSGLRTMVGGVVAAADGILRSRSFALAHRPGFVLGLGAPWASKVVSAYLASVAAGGAETILVDPWWRWIDPDGLATETVRAEPSEVCRAVVAAGEDSVTSRDRAWYRAWMAAESAAQEAIDSALVGTGWSEPALARRLVGMLPAGTDLMVSSSMPIRDVEAYGAPRRGFARVLANRGANGIDGVVSTALGVSWAGGLPTVALLGDLAFLHDVSALVQGDGSGPRCTLVVADNGGGGIFSFLPPAAALREEVFERLFGTPQTSDVGQVAAGFGIPVTEITEGDGEEALSAALDRGTATAGLSVVRVRLPERSRNVDLHRRLDRAMLSAVEALG